MRIENLLKYLDGRFFSLLETEHSTSLASTIFIGQPIGSLLSGIITDRIGRRMTMLLVSIPNAIAWLMLAFTHSVPVIYISFGFFGIGAGLMEAPIMTYLGEIWYVVNISIVEIQKYLTKVVFCFSEPSIRGVLMAFSGISSAAGTFMVFLLGAFHQWRHVALCCSFVPMTTILAVSLVKIETTPLLHLNLKHIVISNIFAISRYPKLQYGSYRKIVRMKHRKHCDGYVAGSPHKPFPSNSKLCNVIMQHPMLV